MTKGPGFRVQGLGVTAVGVLLLLAMVVVVRGDGQRLWMNWGDLRADSGRTRMQTDATGAWSEREALRGRVALRTTATVSSPEGIPMPAEPGSRVGSVEIPAEQGGDVVKPVWK